VTTLAKFLVTGTSKFELMSTVMDRTSQSSGLVFLLIIPVYFQVSVGAGGIINDCWRMLKKIDLVTPPAHFTYMRGTPM